MWHLQEDGDAVEWSRCENRKAREVYLQYVASCTWPSTEARVVRLLASRKQIIGVRLCAPLLFRRAAPTPWSGSETGWQRYHRQSYQSHQ